MIIALASDHAGYEMKMAIKEKLEKEGYEILDLGTDSTESVDYPIYGKAIGEAVAQGKAEKGIAVCGTGIGISIAANKVKGIRCALCTSVEMARLAKEHNNANILAMGGRTTSKELAFQMIDEWFNAEFLGGKHQRRISMLDEM
ncbi:ribose 5-phosphate isomerase B [Mobilibacterium timonense]|uniref:ribose 5-phosphate isomerase B n=1 Tax=Mobilibacterium timonense TaxID=1871012 RepID=UPI0023542110|nr:ribose 5-phosphate isomerase B [Mobilibacterium timonense]MBM6991482.1 ribose 5-phosphate isomerase B [Mobilibacterium timonense]